MPDEKIFRVVLIEQQSFHVDIIATSASEAMRKVRSRLKDPEDPIQPIEDSNLNMGYEVEDAYEITRDIADLE